MYVTFTWHIEASDPAQHEILLQALDCFGVRNLPGCDLDGHSMLFGIRFEKTFEDLYHDLAHVADEHPEFSWVLLGNLAHGWYVWSSRFPPGFDVTAARNIVSPS